MKKSLFVLAAAVLFGSVSILSADEWKSGIDWVEPPVVDPGPETAPANVPSDAIVLFDGKSMEAWENGENSDRDISWVLGDGASDPIMQKTLRLTRNRRVVVDRAGTRLFLLAAAEELAEALGQFLIDLLFDLVLG